MATADGDDISHIDHPLVEPEALEDRQYQTDLAAAAGETHTLVCLPTGLGKTTVSLLVTADRLQTYPDGKSLLLAPTKPLVEQHAAFYRNALTIPDEEIVVFTGDVRPADRADTWETATIIVATPQVIENDLIGDRIALDDVVHLTFDECHRATGDYAYTFIADRYYADAENPLVTGMSASPGDDEAAIRQVCENLGIERVEVRTEDDADVANYTHQTDVTWERVELPEEILDIRDTLETVIEDRLADLKDLGVVDKTDADLSQQELDRIRGNLQSLIDAGDASGYEGMSIHAEVMKLRRAVELVETQSVESLRRYFERQRNAARSSGASKASQRLVSDPRVKRAMAQADAYDDLHPKYRRARMLLAETLGIQEGERVIVFTESRDTAETLTDFLGDHFDVHRFVGQGDTEGSDGMTQREQQETLDAFRHGEFEVLVSTSVAEEGLDVPEVDLVLFYEPVPTAIRSIQRKGRTGRQMQGRVVVLLAEDTRDEAYFWISRRREREMEAELRELRDVADELTDDLGGQVSLTDYGSGTTADPASPTPTDGGDEEQPGLDQFDASAEDQSNDQSTSDDAEAVSVVVDQRELDTHIGRTLSTRDDVSVELDTLDVGDYILSDRVAVERKEVNDFVDSLVGEDRSVFEQVGDIARHYQRPVIVLEGEGLYDARDVHPNAIRGALASLTVDFGASILRTTEPDDTAALLAVIADREQRDRQRSVSTHGKKAARTLAEQQEYVVSSIADVGPVTARTLLEAFGTVEATLTASREDLLEVSGIGEVTADRIREVVSSDYDP